MIELHRKLIGDTVRNKAFYAALQSVLKRGSTVIDIGSGTGFLSFLAMKLGAKSCTLIESNEILETSKKLAKRNGIKGLTFINKHSTEIATLPKADIVISETLGNFAYEENIIETMTDARRFLKPNGVMIPQKLTQFVCPVTSDRLARDIDVWSAFDLDFTEARETSLHNIYVKTVMRDDLLGENDAARAWDHVDFSVKNKSLRTGKEVWKALKPITVHGFALWWDCELTKGIHLSTSPLSPPTHWEQIYLPLLAPIVVAAGQTVELSLTSDSRYSVKINVAWTVRLLDARGKVLCEQRMDMRKGY